MVRERISRGMRVGLVFAPVSLFLAVFEFALPLRLASLDTQVWVIGAFITGSWIVGTLLDPLLGIITQRFGQRRTIITSILLLGALISVFGFTESLIALFFITFFAYLAYDTALIALSSYMISTTPRQAISNAMSGFFSMWNASYVIGPLLAAAIIVRYGYAYPYLMALPLAIISIGAFIRFVPEKPVSARFDYRASIAYLRNLMRTESVLLVGVIAVQFWFSMLAIGLPLLMLLEEGNLWFSALMALSLFIPLPFGNLITDRLAHERTSRYRMLIAGFALGGTSTILLAFVQSVPLLAFITFLGAFGMSVCAAILEVEAGLIARSHHESEIEGVFVFAKNIGSDIAPFIFGVLASIMLRLPFLVLSGLIAIVVVAFLRSERSIR